MAEHHRIGAKQRMLVRIITVRSPVLSRITPLLLFLATGCNSFPSKEAKPSLIPSPAASRIRFVGYSDEPLFSALMTENTSPNCRPTGKVFIRNADSQNDADVLAKEQVVRRGGNVLQTIRRGRQFAEYQYNKYGQLASDAVIPRGDYEVEGFSFNCR